MRIEAKVANINKAVLAKTYWAKTYWCLLTEKEGIWGQSPKNKI